MRFNRPFFLFVFMIVGPSFAEDSIKGKVPPSVENPEGIFLPDPPRPEGIQYINPDIPDFKTPEYTGDRYEALVPATLDLAERARLALHAVTSMTNPNIDYEQYFTVTHMSRPPAMDHNASDMHGHGKFLEVTPLMRVMSGSEQNKEVERTWLEVTLKMQGPDGLIYVPTTGRTWILPPNMDVASGSPGSNEFEGEHFCLLGYGTARTLGSLCLYADLDPEGPWAEAARKLAEAYKEMLIVEDDQAYLFSTWMQPGREVVKTKNHPFMEYFYLAGSQGWVSHYLALYALAQNAPWAAKYAEMMMNYNMYRIEYNEADGRFRPSKGVGAGPGAEEHQYAHFHTHAMNILACLSVYENTGNEDLLERALAAYEWGKSQGEPLVGFFPMVTYDKFYGAQTAETCQVADMVHAGVVLSTLGHDRWDDVDRWVRNQLAENQLTSTCWVTDGRLDYSRSEVAESFFTAGQRTTDRVLERTLGSFAGWPSANDWASSEDWMGGDKQDKIYTIMNCCTASGARALFYAWRDMISHEQGTLQVNLLLNRASKWADIESHIPYQGRVDFKIKEPVNLRIRIPEWVDTNEIQARVGEESKSASMDGKYLTVDSLKKGETLTLSFPISERTEKRTIEGFDYTFIIRGADVVSVDPPGELAPLYNRGHYRVGETLYRKVERFVPDETFDWF